MDPDEIETVSISERGAVVCAVEDVTYYADQHGFTDDGATEQVAWHCIGWTAIGESPPEVYELDPPSDDVPTFADWWPKKGGAAS